MTEEGKKPEAKVEEESGGDIEDQVEQVNSDSW